MNYFSHHWIKENIIDKKYELSASIAMAVINFVLFNKDVNDLFYLPHYSYILFGVYRFIAFILSVGLFYFLISNGRKFYEEISHKRIGEFSFWACYLLINSIVLLFVWPGIYKGDEYYTLPFIITNFEFHWNQSYFTNIFYALSLMIFPLLAGITFIQVVIISGIATDIFKRVQSMLTNKKLAWLLLMPFLLLPVIDNNLFTLRTSLIAWLLTDIVVRVLCSVNIKNFTSIQTQCPILLMETFIGVWKIEYVYILIIHLGVLMFLLLIKRISGKYLLKCVSLVLAAYFIFSLPTRLWAEPDNYLMTIVLTPLSEVIEKNEPEIYTNPDIADDLDFIDSVFPISKINERGEKNNIPDYYWKMDVIDKDTINHWMLSAIRVCTYYWKDALSNKLYMYYYTNGMIPNVINHTGHEDEDIILHRYYWEDYYFDIRFNYTTPFMGEDVRINAISFIACRNPHNYTQTNMLYPVMYNSFIPFALMIIHSAISLVRKKYTQFLLDVSSMLIVPIIFITAPAVFWMYYMPFYLSAYTLLTVYAITGFDVKKICRQ